MNETLEAYTLVTAGALSGVGEYIIKPLVEEQPVLTYMFAGAIGGLLVSKVMDRFLA